MGLTFKRSIVGLACIGIIAAAFLIYANSRVSSSAERRVWTSVEQVPFNPVGVVPGTRPGGTYFQNRIRAAAELYRAGKVK